MIFPVHAFKMYLGYIKFVVLFVTYQKIQGINLVVKILVSGSRDVHTYSITTWNQNHKTKVKCTQIAT